MSRFLKEDQRAPAVPRPLIRAAGVVGSATFLSRVLGMGRDMATAAVLGANAYSDAFFVALRLPNLVRKLLADGALGVALVPVLTECRRRQGQQAALALGGAVLGAAIRTLGVVVLLAVVFAPLLVRCIGLGFLEDPQQFALTVRLTRLMLPYLLCAGMAAVFSAVLNTLGHFTAPALTPVFLNVAMLTGLAAGWFLFGSGEAVVYGLAGGLLVGGVLQVALQMPYLAGREVSATSHKAAAPALGAITRRLLPGAVGASAYQLNMLVGTLLASFLPVGNVTALYYADRIVQFPLGLFVTAMATVLLPALSRQACEKDLAALRATIGETLSLVGFVILPAMVGLMVLAKPVTMLLFGHGAYRPEAVDLTARVLFFYAAGLPAFAVVRLLSSVFHALQDTGTPLKLAAVSVAANGLLGGGLIRLMGTPGLGVAACLAALLTLGLLWRALVGRLGSLSVHWLRTSACKTLAGSAIMGFIVWAAVPWLIPSDETSVGALLAGVLGCVFLGVGAYGALAVLMRCPELALLRTVFRKGGKNA